MDTDEELFQRVRGGDMRAFDLLYARYETRLFGFLMGLLGSRADAEDVFHEAFMRTLKSAEVTFDRGREGGFRAWLFRIARNVASNRRRSDVRGKRAVLAIPEVEPTQGADDALLARQRIHALEGAVGRLPPALSELYELRTSGLSYEEIADVLEIPIGTLKSRMHQMVTALREEMKEWTAGA